MKTYLFILLNLISATNLFAENQYTVNGKVSTTQVLVLRTQSYQYTIKPDEDGNFSVNLKFDVFPFYFTIHDVSKKGKYKKVSPLIWVDNESDQPILEIEEDHIILKNKSETQILSETIENAKGNEKINIIENNLSKIPALCFLKMEMEKTSISRLEELFNKIPATSNNFYYQIEAYINASKRPLLKKGRKIEPFTLIDVEDRKQNIFQNTSTTKIIAILSSGCSYSMASISLLKQVEEKKNEHIEIITIWDQQRNDPWQIDEAKQKEKIVWMNLWDRYGFTHHYLRIKSHPTFYVVSPDGVLKDKFAGYSKRTAKKFGNLLNQFK